MLRKPGRCAFSRAAAPTRRRRERRPARVRRVRSRRCRSRARPRSRRERRRRARCRRRLAAPGHADVDPHVVRARPAVVAQHDRDVDAPPAGVDRDVGRGDRRRELHRPSRRQRDTLHVAAPHLRAVAAQLAHRAHDPRVERRLAPLARREPRDPHDLGIGTVDARAAVRRGHAHGDVVRRAVAFVDDDRTHADAIARPGVDEGPARRAVENRTAAHDDAHGVRAERRVAGGQRRARNQHRPVLARRGRPHAHARDHVVARRGGCDAHRRRVERRQAVVEHERDGTRRALRHAVIPRPERELGDLAGAHAARLDGEREQLGDVLGPHGPAGARRRLRVCRDRGGRIAAHGGRLPRGLKGDGTDDRSLDAAPDPAVPRLHRRAVVAGPRDGHRPAIGQASVRRARGRPGRHVLHDRLGLGRGVPRHARTAARRSSRSSRKAISSARCRCSTRRCARRRSRR